MVKKLQIFVRISRDERKCLLVVSAKFYSNDNDFRMNLEQPKLWTTFENNLSYLCVEKIKKFERKTQGCIDMQYYKEKMN